MEKGSQCVGMNECSRDTVAMPPIVDASSAVHRSPPTPPPPSISWFDSAAVRALGTEICEARYGRGRKRVEGKANGGCGAAVPSLAQGSQNRRNSPNFSELISKVYNFNFFEK
jgi:hypothetical protein